MTPLFEVRDLHVTVGSGTEAKKVLKGVSLKIMPGEVHALMGRNGSGKTTLAYALMGHPKYHVTQGQIFLDGEEITALEPQERAKKRVFLGFQYPVVIPGVSVAQFLRSSVRAVRGEEVAQKEFRPLVKRELKRMGISEAFMTRSLNDGFSGGEKKRLEILQMRLLEPKIAILDETDSGLDIDALKTVATNIDEMRSNARGFLLITHYQRLLNYIKPDHVHIFHDGRIVGTAGPEMAEQLEAKGYDEVLQEMTARTTA